MRIIEQNAYLVSANAHFGIQIRILTDANAHTGVQVRILASANTHSGAQMRIPAYQMRILVSENALSDV